MFVIGRNDIFMMRSDFPRRVGLSARFLRRLNVGDQVRNYELRGDGLVLFPYEGGQLSLVRFPASSVEAKYFGHFADELSDRPTFAGTFAEDGKVPYQYHQLPVERAKDPRSLVLAQITTHGHFVFDPSGCAFNEKAPLVKLSPSAAFAAYHLLASVLNSATALFWLKQVCFNKGAGEDEERDRFEFAGGKVEQLPVPEKVAQALKGEWNPLAKR
jgi:hypothetical protein